MKISNLPNKVQNTLKQVMKKLQWSGLSLSYQPYFLLLPHKLFFVCLFVSLIAWFCFSFLGQSFNMLWAFPTSCLGLSHSFYLECSLHQISSSVSKGFLCRSLKMETQADHSNKVIYFTLWEPLKFLVLFIMLLYRYILLGDMHALSPTTSGKDCASPIFVT